MLLATTKLFFKKPAEMKPILSKFYSTVLKKYYDVDLRDRVYFFYNLLKNDVELAEFIINGDGERAIIDKYLDDFEGETLVYFKHNIIGHNIWPVQYSLCCLFKT